MEKIEDCEAPIIGKWYLVRAVFIYNKWIPVFSHKHKDSPKHALPQEHYHKDWRFIPQADIDAQRAVFSATVYKNLPDENREYFAPVIASNISDEKLHLFEYLRDFNVFDFDFGTLKYDMRKAKMKSMICPHHKTNLTSCKVINGVIQCPQHGLKWNVKTGNLII